MLHPLRLLRTQLMAIDLGAPVLQHTADFSASSLHAPRARAAFLQRLCQRACRLHHLDVQVTGELPDEPVIYVANHLGYVDPVAICSLTPCAPIAKLEVASWPVIGAICRQMNVIFVRRDDTGNAARALRLAVRRLEAGVSVLNFPEGTTTRGDVLGFRRGVFGVSGKLGIPVVPLALSFAAPGLCWVDDDSFVAHYARTVIGTAHSVQIQVGPLMRLRAGETATEFAARARAWIVAARRRGEGTPEPQARRPLPGVVHAVGVAPRVERQVRELAAAATTAVQVQTRSVRRDAR